MERLTREVLDELFVWNMGNSLPGSHSVHAALVELRKIRCLMEQYNIPDLRALETLLKANAEGQAVVLPCKVGDTVWFVPSAGRKNFYCGTVVAIETNKYTSVIYTDSEYSARYGLDVEYIGKYLFLTRQEAEAAIEKEKTNG